MFEQPLSDKVALVTGASYGLGMAIAQALASRGAAIVLTDIDDRLADAGAKLPGLAQWMTVKLDVTDRTSFASAVDAALDRFGSLDVLVNNAGYSRTTLPLLDMDPEEWRLSMDVNVSGALFGIQEAGRAMIARGGGGRIINVASTAAFRPYRMKSPYCVSKSALVALTRAAALELADHQITVNAVAPGQTDTETTRILQQDPKSGAAMRARADAIPLGVGQPEDVASAVCNFAAPDAARVTGQVLIVDGGTLLI